MILQIIVLERHEILVSEKEYTIDYFRLNIRFASRVLVFNQLKIELKFLISNQTEPISLVLLNSSPGYRIIVSYYLPHEHVILQQELGFSHLQHTFFRKAHERQFLIGCCWSVSTG